MVYDHKCGICLILWFLEANTHSRCISFVKEVGGIIQIFYLFLIVGRLLLDTKNICGMRAQHMCYPSSPVLVLNEKRTRMWLKNCSISEKSGPGLRCFWLLPGWSQLSVWILEVKITRSQCQTSHVFTEAQIQDTHAHRRKKDFKQQDITSAINRPFSSSQLLWNPPDGSPDQIRAL